MMKLDVYKIDGTKSGDSVELSEEVFGIEPNDHVIYLSVKAYLANQRQGTHKTKERNEKIKAEIQAAVDQAKAVRQEWIVIKPE